MSSQYIERLRAVRGEFEAAKQGVAFVSQNWQRYDIYNAVEGVTLENFRQAEQYLFSTYLVRLSAEFEGILKHHLETNYPEIDMPENPKVDWLISEVSRQEGFKTDPNLRANMNKVRDYRNKFVHSGQLPKATFDFSSALSWFNTFLVKLPDPVK